MPASYVLHVGDCLAVLPTLESGSVDAVITDPPYGSKTHAGARTTRPGVGLATEPLIHFASIDQGRFLWLCREWVRVARRWVVATCDWRHAAHVEHEMPDEFVRCGVWIKPDSAPQFTGDRPGVGWEAILILHRKGRKRWNNGGHHAVWIAPVERDRLHPTQKPLHLLRQWVAAFTDSGETILDPFMGSGTTGVAAVREGRKFVGIEMNPDYVEIARGRLGELPRPGGDTQRTLFDATPAGEF